jgi:hypothetical protein
MFKFKFLSHFFFSIYMCPILFLEVKQNLKILIHINQILIQTNQKNPLFLLLSHILFLVPIFTHVHSSFLTSTLSFPILYHFLLISFHMQWTIFTYALIFSNIYALLSSPLSFSSNILAYAMD